MRDLLKVILFKQLNVSKFVILSSTDLLEVFLWASNKLEKEVYDLRTKKKRKVSKDETRCY